MVTFDIMCPEPFLNYDEQEFNARTPASKDLYVYPVINNDRDGGREIDPGHGYLYYTWVRPGEGLGTRYIVATPIQITLEPSRQSPQAGVSLVRYYNRTTSTIRTTAAPIAPQDGFAYDAHLGHVMTAPPSSGEPVVKIEECYRTKGSVTDYGIGWDGHCIGNGLTRIRSTGWLFKAALPGTKPIYSCLDQNGHGLYASNLADCEGHGSVLNLLGHALAN
jgi:hypothetical protein